FGDRKAGIGKPRRAANQHEGEQHQQNDIEPAAHQRAVGELPLVFAAYRTGASGVQGLFHGGDWWTIGGVLARLQPSRQAVASASVMASRRCAADVEALSGCLKGTNMPIRLKKLIGTILLV